MRGVMFTAILLGPLALACQRSMDSVGPDQIIAMERAALDRWGRGDPRGYLEIMGSEVTYFDPSQDKRVDGLGAMEALLVPLTGTIKIDRYEMIDPAVQRHGDVALLTFNLVSYQMSPEGVESAVARWNSTETYAVIDGRWRIIHSHWSYIRPEFVPEEDHCLPQAASGRLPQWRCAARHSAQSGREAGSPCLPRTPGQRPARDSNS